MSFRHRRGLRASNCHQKDCRRISFCIVVEPKRNADCGSASFAMSWRVTLWKRHRAMVDHGKLYAQNARRLLSRFDTHIQGHDGLGMEAQRLAVTAFAVAHSATILTMYSEVKTGRKKRPSKSTAARQRPWHMRAALVPCSSLLGLTGSRETSS